MSDIRVDTGSYATACEKSKFKDKIDQWLNEGKSCAWISGQLKILGDPISDKSIGKYKAKRDERIQEQLMLDPNYQTQITTANQALVDEIAKMKPVNVMNHLAKTIEHCAELIERSRLDDIKITKVQDLRFVHQSMLEALKLYGDTIMNAQKFAKIEDDPTLLKPTHNTNVQNVLINVLGGMEDDERTNIIDRLRTSLIKP